MMRRLAYALAAACLLMVAACTTEETPEAETILRVRLHDSLARYDKVVVQLFDRNDSTKLLATLWKEALPMPGSAIPGLSLKDFPTKSFIVRVTAYKAQDQLALQTTIFYDTGNKTVRHDAVPPLKPLNYLTSISPSVGLMAPPFHKDSLKYTITLPLNVNALSFSVLGSIPGVSILVDGAAVASGTSSKIHQIGAKGDTLPITVTDTITGTAATRIYTMTVVTTNPPGMELVSLSPSVGAFNVEFNPKQILYVLYMPAGVDTISFRAKPADTKTMTMVIDGEAVFWPSPSKVITVPKGANHTVNIDLYRGSEQGYYQITVDHTQTADH